MVITTDVIMKLRELTGAGIMDCKNALKDSLGDIDKAVQILREKGVASAQKKALRSSREGIIYAYVHHGNRLGVLIELNCETDFVARNEEFISLAKELAMQIAAANPRWIKREDVPQDVLAQEREIYAAQAQQDKKDPKIIQRIVDGKVEKFYALVCLMEQPYIRDASGKTMVKDMVTTAITKFGENIIVRRFIRYQLGGE